MLPNWQLYLQDLNNYPYYPKILIFIIIDFYLSYNACILQFLCNWKKNSHCIWLVYVLEIMTMDIQGVFIWSLFNFNFFVNSQKQWYSITFFFPSHLLIFEKLSLSSIRELLKNGIYFNTNKDLCSKILSFVTLIEQPIYFHSRKLPILVSWKVLEQLLTTCCVDQKTH